MTGCHLPHRHSLYRWYQFIYKPKPTEPNMLLPAVASFCCSEKSTLRTLLPMRGWNKPCRNVALNITSTWCHKAPLQMLLKHHSGIRNLCRLMLPLYHDCFTVCFPPSLERDTWCKTHWTVTLLPLLSLCLPSHPPGDVAVITGSGPGWCRLTDTMF